MITTATKGGVIEQYHLPPSTSTAITGLHSEAARVLPEVEQHLLTVGALAKDYADHVRLPKPDRDHLITASLVFDIGKLDVKDLITKPGPLTDEEFSAVKRHAEIGADRLQQMPELAHVAESVRAHHVDYDGGGYPKLGLQGEQIPYTARALRIFDSYAAMTQLREFRPARPASEAVAEIAANKFPRNPKGMPYDPKIVAPFVEMIRKTIETASVSHPAV
jgi:response regulator RpfG family c-di-GMP phosphodiesterase